MYGNWETGSPDRKEVKERFEKNLSKRKKAREASRRDVYLFRGDPEKGRSLLPRAESGFRLPEAAGKIFKKSPIRKIEKGGCPTLWRPPR